MEEKALINIEESAMTLDDLVGQVNLIQKIMDKVMKSDEHYGTIPGTEKPTLLKPGAEKLCLTFRLDPDYDIIREVREKEFIAYTVKCILHHISSGMQIASGIGSCNSRETKYRYRSQSTGKPVPKEYWADRDNSILGGPQYSPRKKEGRWLIYEQIENDNPWDLDNTLIKMACKRALIAATLNATAASDIFTQDLEDMPEGIVVEPEIPVEPQNDATSKRSPEKQASGKGKKADKAKEEKEAKKDPFKDITTCDVLNDQGEKLNPTGYGKAFPVQFCIGGCSKRTQCQKAIELAEKYKKTDV